MHFKKVMFESDTEMCTCLSEEELLNWAPEQTEIRCSSTENYKLCPYSEHGNYYAFCPLMKELNDSNLQGWMKMCILCTCKLYLSVLNELGGPNSRTLSTRWRARCILVSFLNLVYILRKTVLTNFTQIWWRMTASSGKNVRPLK